MAFDPGADYPLGSERPDLVTTPAGHSLDDMTLDALRAGRLGFDEMRATPETLRRQAAIARHSERGALAESLERAAELATVPSETILELYTALRPHRATPAALEAWAERLESEFSAPLNAGFVREAAAVYAARGLFHERADATA